MSASLLGPIGQVAITVADVPKATAFYRDVLGLQFLFSPGPNLAFFAADSVRLMLTAPESTGHIGKNSILYFKVADVQASHTTLLQRGAKNERAPRLVANLPDHDLWMAFVQDMDGNLVGLMEERPKQAAATSPSRGVSSSMQAA